ncbi:alpha/beta hydrolase [Chryseobacterium suipulveris]|uniref:Alpha/beta hydrolase n=1 Tax=Chryseobacterium suipulveris TaxID=2929800 RepID=A0ABY4BRN7_9FLAO|nr:alpha/beta hydrolase [Chryseobacterium suipulveris]UOE41429.1 alpha/beta hydrolase [Chryseobacterium suipulveris]
MKNFLFVIFGYLIISCSGSTTGNPTDEPQNLAAKDEMNISYGSNTQQKYDIFLPAGRSADKTKVLIYIHGGGWIAGDKSEIYGGLPKMKQTYFPKYAIVTMNYVLAQPGTSNYALPNHINDIQHVINQIKAKSQEYQVKPEFVLCGSSAGAHLSMFYAYTKNNPEVKAVVNMVGPSDFNDSAFSTNPLAGYFSGFVNPASVPSGMNMLTYASPLTWITNASVPTLGFYGTGDTTVPLSQKNLLEAKLTQENVPHEIYTYNGDHVGWMSEPITSWMLDKTKKFLEKYNP